MTEVLTVAAIAYLLITFVSPICEAIFDWINDRPVVDRYFERNRLRNERERIKLAARQERMKAFLRKRRITKPLASLIRLP